MGNMGNAWLWFVVGAFATGIAAASLILVPAVIYWFLGCTGILLLFYFWYELRVRKVRFTLDSAPLGFLIGLTILSGVSGALWAEYRASAGHDKNAAQYVEHMVAARGVIIDEPDVRERNTLLALQVAQLSDVANPNSLQPVNTTLLLFADKYPPFAYGDELFVRGVLAEPQAFETDSGRIFDYPAYLRAHGIRYIIYRPQIEKVGEDQGSPFFSFLFHIKNSFVRAMDSVVPEPESSLLGGLLLGSKHSLPEQLSEYLRRAGVIHIVVLSGYNLTLVAQAIERALVFVALRYRLVLASGGIISFVLMTGAGAASLRAGLMALLVLLARALGRDYRVERALLLAILAMLILNPNVLLFDPSFQLSILATFGLIYIAPFIERLLHVRESWWREIIVATVATQIAVLPLLLYMTGEISLVGLLVNLLILPLIPLTMFWGFVAGMSALVWVPLGLLPGYAAYLLLHYELGVASWFGSLSLATVAIPNFSIWFLFGSCLLLGGLLFYIHNYFPTFSKR